MTLEERRNTEHTGFAVYGFSPCVIPIGDLYDWALGWFTRFGLIPDKIGANLFGKTDGLYKKFRGRDRKLRESRFSGTTYWELISIPEELRAERFAQNIGEDMTIAYDTREYNRYFVFCIQSSVIRDRISEYFMFAEDVCRLLKPQYGIGYRRLFRHIPMLFGAGFPGGGDSAFGNLDHWRMLVTANCFTYLRDVFPWNFFTDIQLNLKIGGIRLEDWIRSNPNRGSLQPFTDTVTLWTIPDESLPAIRHALWEAKIILDRKRDCESILNEYRCGDAALIEYLITGVLPKKYTGPGITEEEVLGMFVDKGARVLKVTKHGVAEELPPAKVEAIRKKAKKGRA